MKKQQNQIWEEHTKDLTLKDVRDQYTHPTLFQKELKSLIDAYKQDYRDIIEVGCETGATSFILDDSFSKTLLDVSPTAIALAKKAFRQMRKNVHFVIADMFAMPFENESFDLVFNAGVLEHFTKNERTAALKEYARILNNNGVMIIAIPNHYSIPYRFSYLIRQLLKRWPFPEEYKIYDMKEEIADAGLVLEKRVVLAKQTIFHWVNFFKALRILFEFLDKFFDFEGYLTTLIIKKPLSRGLEMNLRAASCGVFGNAK